MLPAIVILFAVLVVTFTHAQGFSIYNRTYLPLGVPGRKERHPDTRLVEVNADVSSTVEFTASTANLWARSLLRRILYSNFKQMTR
ncbi:hypothetical protein BKA56DRAFT_588324 [Ilyonectria sp. MPI-CAGE-AT-0026]|nr:hypothetical protein BKA56DRAFT_588324 [Ilyonectria sp. MPI-CAGE-AT-0026]